MAEGTGPSVSTHSVPGLFMHVISPTSRLMQGGGHQFSEFTEEETEAQRSYVTCQRSHSGAVGLPGLEPGLESLQRPAQPDAGPEQGVGEGLLPSPGHWDGGTQPDSGCGTMGAG